MDNLANFMYLSSFAFDKCEVTYHCITDDYVVHKIHECTIYYSNSAIQNNGITELKLKLNTLNRVSVDEYEDFDVIRVGNPQKLNLNDTYCIASLSNILDSYNGLIGYWDSRSLAFILHNNKRTLKKVLVEFLNQELIVKTAKEGLQLSLNIPNIY